MGLYENKNNSLSLLAGGTCYADSPVGAILPFGGSNPPSGYLLCDGQAVSRSYYAELFAIIGTSFGAGDGSTTFNVPNLKGKTPVGLDSSDTDFNAIGKSGGEKTHKLTIAEMPTHTHTQNAHTHDYNKITSNGDSFGVYGGGGYGGWGIGIAGTNNNYGRFGIVAATATNQNTGGGGAHNNLQPYVTTNYIIKAKQSALPLPFEDAVDEKISDNIINSIASGSMKAATSNAVYGFPIDSVTDGEHRPPTSNAVYDMLASLIKYGSGYLQIGTVLICYGSVAPTINITNAYGSGGLYYGTDTTTRAFAKSFASVPIIQITPHPGWGNNGSIIDCARNANGITSVTVVSNISDSAKHWNYDYVAIGTASS